MKLHLLPLFFTLFSSVLAASDVKITHLCIDPSVLFKFNQDKLYEYSYYDPCKIRCLIEYEHKNTKKEDILKVLFEADGRTTASHCPIFSEGKKLLLSYLMLSLTKEQYMRSIGFYNKQEQRSKYTYSSHVCQSGQSTIRSCDIRKIISTKTSCNEPIAPNQRAFYWENRFIWKLSIRNRFQEHFPEIAEMIDLPYLSGTIGMVKTNPGFSKVTPFPPRSTLCIETQPEHCHKMYTCEVIEHDGRSLLKILAAYGICKPSLISSQLIRENHFQVETKEKTASGKNTEKDWKSILDEWELVQDEKIL